MTSYNQDRVQAVAWAEDAVRMLDQRALPGRCDHLLLGTSAEVAGAIRTMVVRGAPAIGIAAAYGVVLAAREAYATAGQAWRDVVDGPLETLARARPTAVNLGWAIARMRGLFPDLPGDPELPLLQEAQTIHQQDIAGNRRMGDLGAALLGPRVRVLTHCNAGALATGGYGTALGVVRSAHARGQLREVYAGETRPWLQGARLTAWELLEDGIPVKLLADGAAAWLMATGAVDWVIVGADRVAANGDVANKIGTLGLAVNARHHGVKFMVVAPSSSIDLDVPDGSHIPIEERAADEILNLGTQTVAAAGAAGWNPVFDVTPAALVDALVTERGVAERPDAEAIRRLMRRR